MGYIIVCHEPEQVASGEIYVCSSDSYTSNISEAFVYETREAAVADIDFDFDLCNEEVIEL